MTRVPSDALVLQNVTPAGMETISQEEREDSMITGSLSKADRKNSKRMAKDMTQNQPPKVTDRRPQGGKAQRPQGGKAHTWCQCSCR